MLRKMLVPLLSLALLFLPTLTALAQTTAAQSQEEKQQAKEAQRVAKIKQRVVGLGTNKVAVVELQSGAKLSGRISEIRDDGFILQAAEQGQISSRDLKYDDLVRVSEKGAGKRLAGRAVLYTAAAFGATVLIVGLIISSRL